MKHALMAAAVLILAAGCKTAAPPRGEPTATAPPSSASPAAACDPALWAHVYHPARLHVIRPCITITGTIEAVRHEPDGDLHILLKPDQPGLVNAANIRYQHGDLVLEPVCEGPVTQPDAVSACSGYRGTVTIPRTGERVIVTGSWVLDAEHGWLEIHPVTTITAA